MLPCLHRAARSIAAPQPEEEAADVEGELQVPGIGCQRRRSSAAPESRYLIELASGACGKARVVVQPSAKIPVDRWRRVACSRRQSVTRKVLLERQCLINTRQLSGA